MNQCVACGEEYSGDNHHCNPRRERQIEQHRSLCNEPRIQGHTFSERLNNGFNILASSYDEVVSRKEMKERGRND